ncbi:hypothetical protein [Lentilactobacillus senioris]
MDFDWRLHLTKLVFSITAAKPCDGVEPSDRPVMAKFLPLAMLSVGIEPA